MENLIYYPGFEVKDENWLKFALLYIDKLSPIIPEAGMHYLSPFFRMIQNYTDLLNIHSPKNSESELASLVAIDTVEKILRNPQHYSRYFRNNDIIKIWQIPVFHNYTLFRDKFVGNWEKFCLEHRFASNDERGILINEQLGYVYMTILAHIIADKRGISPITDHRNFDRFAIAVRESSDVTERRVTVAQTQINLILPNNIDEISIDKFIKLRNQTGFKERLSAFHDEFNKYLSNIEQGNVDSKFTVTYREIINEYKGDILKIGGDFISIGLLTWLVLKQPDIDSVVINPLEGIPLVIHTFADITDTWKNTRTKRFTMKYLADIHNIVSD